jgi:hypothetical protein
MMTAGDDAMPALVMSLPVTVSGGRRDRGGGLGPSERLGPWLARDSDSTMSTEPARAGASTRDLPVRARDSKLDSEGQIQS